MLHFIVSLLNVLNVNTQTYAIRLVVVPTRGFSRRITILFISEAHSTSSSLDSPASIVLVDARTTLGPFGK